MARSEWEHLPAWVQERTARADGDECWLWTGPRSAKDGRGRGWDPASKRSVVVPRAVVAAMVGRIPAALVVMHLCDNPPCVRPSHLRLGTTQENMLDALQKGRLRNQHGPVPPQAAPNIKLTARERHLISTGQSSYEQVASTRRGRRLTRDYDGFALDTQAIARREVLSQNI